METWRELITLAIDGETFSKIRFSPDGNSLGALTDSVVFTGGFGYLQ